MYAKIVVAVLTAAFLGTGVAWAQGFARAGYFSLEWGVGKARSGQLVITGYISNNFSLWADNVRLLVEVLDPADRVVANTIGYVDGWVQPNDRAYFWVPVPAGGVAYRVTVHSFNWRSGGR
jgi:hypothetical protein